MLFNNKTREQLIEEMVNQDIKDIKQGMDTGDLSFLNDVLSGCGWKPYSQLTDDEIVCEHKEREANNEDAAADNTTNEVPEEDIVLCEGCRKHVPESELSDVMEMYICNACEHGEENTQLVKEFKVGAYTPFQLATFGVNKFYQIITNKFRELNDNTEIKVTYAEAKHVVVDGSVDIQINVITYSDKE